MGSSEKKLIQSICKELLKTKKLNDDHLSQLSKIFGRRFSNVNKVLEDKRVKKYVFQPSGRVVWIVVGRERDYQVIPEVDFCTCDDFYFRVIEYKAIMCYHLIAQKLSQALDLYDLIEEVDELYETLMKEWREVRIERRTLPITEISIIRKVSEIVLSKEYNLTVHQLLDKIKKGGFDVLTTRHLATIIATDPKKRFKCKNGIWGLMRTHAW